MNLALRWLSKRANQAIRWFRFALLASSFALAGWILWFGGYIYIDQVFGGQRTLFYSTVSTIAATLLGFVLAATSIAIAYSTNDRFAKAIKEHRFPAIVNVFFRAIGSLGVTTLVSLFALIFDREQSPSAIVFCVFLCSVAWAIGETTRCIVTFHTLVDIAIAPSQARRGDQA